MKQPKALVCESLVPARAGLRSSLRLVAVLLLFSGGALAEQQDLTQLSLEDLGSIKVTSVGKKEQSLLKVGAAVYVITQEDIRRSGATNIPDVLRMVPGVDVAQLDANIWVVSIRGFSDRFGDKVLVLIDGRSVYTPTNSGVYWDQQDVPLEDIERIEVIRGPGGTVWGANAVNGVINITTMHAKATPGGLLSAGAGSNEAVQGLAQYGSTIGHVGTYRVFGKYFNVGSLTIPDGHRGADGWHLPHTGFRSDLDLSARDTMTVEGDLLETSEGETVSVVLANSLPQQATFNSRTRVGAGNLLGRWNRSLSNSSDVSLQAYFDDYDRHEEGGLEERHTFDLDFQHHLAIGCRNDVVWGLGYRVTSDDLTAKYSKSFVPQQRTDNLFGTFLQDEIRVLDSLSFTVGAKVEHNGYTGFEFQPSAQLVWMPTRRQAIWASAARAIRQPARADTAIRIDVATTPLDSGTFAVTQIMGDPHRKAEELLGYQAGYRAQATKTLSFDVAGFFNRYHHLQSDEPGTPYLSSSPEPLHTVFPVLSTDRAHAQTYGAEVFANWNITGRWRVSPGYSFINMNFASDLSNQDPSVSTQAGDTPSHKFEIRSQLSLPRNLSWDNTLYYVGALPDQAVPAYRRLDTRVAWRLGETAEISLTGQNLLTPRHSEFGDDTPLHTEMQRSVFGKMTWHF
jgi:iron complex outermembrane receptor protein